MPETNAELREIITEYGLTRRQAAEMMMLDATTSVDRYLVPARRGRSKNPAFRQLPAFRLKLLLVGIRERQLKKVADVG